MMALRYKYLQLHENNLATVKRCCTISQFQQVSLMRISNKILHLCLNIYLRLEEGRY